jgi:hypothetical protein
MGPSGIVLASNHPLRVDLSYDVTQLTLTEAVTDTVTGAIFQTVYTNINIPQTVGGNTAYVGFTGATGGETSIQDVLSWSGRFLDPVQPVSHVSLTAVSAVAGTPTQVIVTARDAFNNVITNYTGTVHFTSSDPQATLPADYPFTAADNGTHTFNNVILRTAGNQTVTATDTTLAYITGNTSVAITPGAPSQFSVAYPAEITAGSLQLFTVTAQDAFGNTAPTYRGTVHLTSSDPRALLTPDATFTAADSGTKTFAAVFLTAGQQTLTATDTQTGAIVGSETVTVDAAAPDHIRFTNPSTVTAGSPFSITVTVQDVYNNTVTGYTGTVHFMANNGAMATYTFLPGDMGTRTFGNLVVTQAGTVTVTGTDTTTPAVTGTTSLTVTPAAASTLVVAGFPSSANRGQAYTFTVTAYDAYGNVATGYTGTIHFSSDDSTATLQADYTFTAADNGTHTFIAAFNQVGTFHLQAADTSDPSIAGEEDGIMVS